ncbi:peptide ABC transporter substrate-binding protein [Paenibacillus planticolens]|uniref:Peptide ABC transporter substrate-binding protein n=1 Tax=Paenibacillus planticolens TaxID=2654976 RepID=A0ABX1ZXF9_9BACL|nr:peptide ABC transporter substrate-binding protein [Paenibacillus planticolens]NOV03652.1 peptide ABC transporter substrate-binding protein [Paenibacillus planticolens]
MKKIPALLISSVLVIGTLLAGCSKDPGAGTPESGAKQTEAAKEAKSKILLYNNLKEPTSLDPPKGFDQVSYDVVNNAFEGLTRLGKNQAPEPAMAKEWKVTPDGKKYTFTLRDGIKWSNGDPVKAADFEYAWKRLLDPKTASDAAFLAYPIEGAEAFNSGKGTADGVKIKALDDKTLEVTLIQPASWLVGMLSSPAFFPVHKATVEGNAKWAGEAATIVSNGPFKITEWKHDSELKMVKNDQYWDAANVKLTGVTFKMINDTNTAYQLFTTGELHTTGSIPADMSDKLFAENKVKVEDAAGSAFYRFNVKMVPFNNVNIRKAFVAAVDRQKLVDLVLKQKQKPADGYVSPGLKDAAGGDFRQVGGSLIKFDAAEAKQLLAKGMQEAGYKTLPEVTLTYNTNDVSQRIAQTLQAMLKDNLGIDVKLANKEGKVLTTEQKALQLQLSRSSFLPDFADPINFLDGFQSTNPFSRTGWVNASYDKLIKDAYVESDEAKRYKLMHDAEKILMDEAPILPLYFYNSTYLQSDKLEGVVRHAFGFLDFKWADLK